jgi:4-amino-4-deoxy-L-arabinose transferase-like glycosyltransferase
MKLGVNRINFQDWVTIIILFSLVVYAAGIFIILMEPDAAVYADISMEMAKTNNFSEIKLKGMDWLDKPHFQFWVTAVFFKVFGINNLGYKLPAILFSLLGAFYVYLYGKRFYSSKHGIIAAIFLITAEHIIISNNDVRAEPYLTCFTIFSLYYFAIYLENKKMMHLIMGSFGLAALLMTKGLYSIIPVASGIGLALIYNKEWKEIINWQWLLVICLTLLMISPTLVAYYFQFDAHPEKEVFGIKGVSGIKFFFWDSQWGRFTNTGPIKGHGDPFFFLHTLIWSFAPWALLAYSGLFQKIKHILTSKINFENYTFFGFLFTFIIFSLSSFQLPHYLNQLFPFLSILTAFVLLDRSRDHRFLRIHYILMTCISTIFIVLVALLHLFYFNNIPHIDVIIVVLAGIIVSLYFIIHNRTLIKRIIIPPAIIILSVNYYLNRQFYPDLLKYQSESELAFYMIDHQLPTDDLIIFEKLQWSTQFYLKKIVPAVNEKELPRNNLSGHLVFTDYEGLKILDKYGYSHTLIQEFKDFHVTGLKPEFINLSTRESTLTKSYLVAIQ